MGDQNIGPLFEFGAIDINPPIDHISIAIELRTLIIKAVANFVAYDRTDSAIVSGIIDIKAEEWWLQNCCWKDDLVSKWVVVGVDCLRGHMPLIAIDRLTDLGEGEVAFKLCNASQVPKEVIGGNF